MATRRRLRTVLAVVCLWAGCGESHGPVDDGGVDAAPAADAGATDAGPTDDDAPRDAEVDAGPPPCPDADGDGHQDVACGGSDCDDGDPDLSPDRARCDGPDERTLCDGPGTRTEACTDPEPACDARTGECVAMGDPCGDGALHPGEECDDGNDATGDGCDAECLREPCETSSDCPDSMPSCSDRRPDGRILCRALDPSGMALGSRCMEDADCASGWCDGDQRKCTAACTSDGDCDGANGWCWTMPSRTHQRPTHTCQYGCFADTHCGEGRACTGKLREHATVTRCVPSAGFVSPREDCSDASDCVTHTCVEGCVALCVVDAHCPEGWTCTPIGVPYPPGWTQEEFRWCLRE